MQSCFLEMNLLIICTSLIFFSSVNGQTVQYVWRFRNFSIESETNSGYLVSFNLFQENYDHKISAVLNITKDIYIKNVEVVLNRCSFEKYDCEYFQRWKFARNLKSIAFMKNQIWTPMYEHITPKPDFPHLKKNVYQSNEVGGDAKLAVAFYPEAVNYFWRVEATLNDHKDKKALVIKLEVSIISFTKKDKTRDGGRTRSTKPKPRRGEQSSQVLQRK